MSRHKGGKNRKWEAEEKSRIIMRYKNGEGTSSKIASEESISTGMLSNWIKRYEEKGFDGLSTKSGNRFGGINNKKKLTRLEELEYENFKLRMENELLKKGLDPERVMRIAKKKRN